jgi:hypothetical protein
MQLSDLFFDTVNDVDYIAVLDRDCASEVLRVFGNELGNPHLCFRRERL